MSRVPLALGLVAILPALALAGYFLLGDLESLRDPCTRWAGDGPVAPSADCPGVSSHSQTRAAYVWTLVWVKGSILAGCAASLAGFGLRQPLLAAVGAWALFAISLPLLLGWGGLPALLSAALVAAATRALPPFGGAALWALRVLSLVALALFGGIALSAAASGLVAFALLALPMLALPLLMAWAAWWPRPPPPAPFGA